MKYRDFGRTSWKVSEIGFGAWAIGGSWGSVDDDESLAALNTAIDDGVNLIDTADVYGDGRSERLIAQVLKERDEQVYVMTKFGRRLNPHNADGYTADNLNRFLDRSLEHLGQPIDLVQLHCPPVETLYRPELFEALDKMVEEGKIRYYGVSVEKVEEALKAIEFPNVQSIQIIFNMFRLRPAELFFKEAIRRKVAVVVRVPLASGMLAGKFNKQSTFESDDHRNFNRHGESFDVGETFSGVDYDTGLEAVERIRGYLPDGMTMAQFALKWILAFDAVSTIIPGAKTPKQAADNTETSDLPDISPETMDGIEAIYNDLIRPQVHQRW